jgi:pullulanase
MRLAPLVAALAALVASLAAAAHAQSRAPKPSLNPRNYGADRIVVVHYARLDGDYDGWNLWAWPQGQEGASYGFDGKDAFGRFAVVPLPRNGDVERIGFIVRKGDWAAKDHDGDRFVEVGKGGVTEAWVVSGDATVHARAPKVDRTPRITAAFLDARDRITVASSVPLDQKSASALEITSTRAAGRFGVRSSRRGAGGQRPVTELQLSRSVPDDEVAALRIRMGDAAVPVYARGVLQDPAFAALDAELGPEVSALRAEFRTWSPVSDKVELLLYGPATGGAAPSQEPQRTVELRRGPKGTWSVSVPGDLHGTAYAYRFTSYGEQRVAADIHCRAATQDSSRSVAVDLSRAAPDGWDADSPPRVAQPTDEVLYELHVRDFSVADSSCPERERGTYLGLVHSGTSPTGGPTGLAYLKRLGITAVHLLPVHDYGGTPGEYNWGYWTALFNVPESNYATDRADPLSAVRDLRAAILGMHRAGIRVVLDVVYNHTCSSGPSSPFDCTVPYWFFRTEPDGSYSNDAGCGNSVADERPMVRKYILDSVSFWLREYHVDGLRFDLLGTHVPETVRAVCERARSVRPDATLYGEPWTGGGPIRFGKGAQRGLRMAVFNDHVRGALRGDTDGASPGFATGAGGDPAAIRRGVMGSIDDFAQEPIETINYVSAHDNLTLVDKIAKASPAAAGDGALRSAMQRLAIGAVLAFQGIPFIEGGSELCRTKGGDHNSYQSGDGVNRYDWNQSSAPGSGAAGCGDTAAWVAGMIAIRRAHPAFRMDDDAEVRRAIEFLPSDGKVVAWTIDGSVARDPARRILVVLNGEPTQQRLTLPAGQWSVLADHDAAGTEPQGKVSGTATLEAWSILVATQ